MPLEIVERKGLGHPDTICDALAETLSRGLSRFYLERFGVLLHHNVDKALLCGGAARPAFGGGQVLAPIEIHLAGRATLEHQGVNVPVDEIAIEGSRGWLRDSLSHLDVGRDVRIVPHIRPTSPALSSLFQAGRPSTARLANDTSFGVGFAPLDTLERLVLSIERTLNAPELKRVHPDIGEDIKVMGARRGSELSLTVACAFVDRHVEDLADYAAKKRTLGDLVRDAARRITDHPVAIAVNAADRDELAGIYLTVTGLSAEAGDDGQVGRGNRVNGLITPYRPMSLEAAAGKNAVSHVGKLYNVMAHRVARAVVSEIPQIETAHCYLLSRIGRSIGDPDLFDVKVQLQDARTLEGLRECIQDVAQDAFAHIELVWREALDGTLELW